MNTYIDKLYDLNQLPKDIYILASFTKAKIDHINIKETYNHIVANTQIIPKNSINPNTQRYIGLQNFNIKTMNIIIISGFENIEKPNTYIVKDVNTQSIFKFVEFTYPLFFEESSLETFFKGNVDLNNTFFLFEKTFWFHIVSMFRMYNYIVTGGNLTKRHILSSIQKQNAKFLFIFNVNEIQAFHGKLKIILQTKVDYTSIEGKNVFNQLLNVMSEDLKNTQQKTTPTQYISPIKIHKRGYTTTSKRLTPFKVDSYNNPSLISFFESYINNPMYTKIRTIFNNKKITAIDKQNQIEIQLTNFWRREIIDLFKNRSKLFNSEYGINILYNNIIKLDQDFTDLKLIDKRNLNGKKHKHLIMCTHNHDIISIVLSHVIPFCIKYDNLIDQDIVKLFQTIGKDIHKIYLSNEWGKYKNNQKLNYIVDMKKDIITIGDDKLKEGVILDRDLSEVLFKQQLKQIIGDLQTEDLIKLGLDLTEFISQKTDLLNLDKRFIKKDYMKHFITPGKNLKYNIFKIITHDSDVFPMITKPIDWVFNKKDDVYITTQYGGYLFNQNRREDLIRDSYKSLGSTTLFTEDTVNAINYLSSVKYTINSDVLEYILSLLESNNNNIINLMKINLHEKTSELFNLVSRKQFKDVNEILAHNSKFYNDKTVLQNALLFHEWTRVKENSIYFPMFIEWRGRMLTNTGFLSYQNTELAKSLLLFKNGEILTTQGLQSLKIYTANCYGLNKKSHNQRMEWIDDNIKLIIKIDSDFIFKADEPLLFMACCFELKGYYNNPTDFISRLPISVDATCNGLQHLSSMIQDSNLAKYVNIYSSKPEDVPEDVYTFMLTIIQKKVDELIESSYEYSKLSLLNIIRKFVKRGIMTISYGATIRGIASQLKSDHFNFNGKIDNELTYVLKEDIFKKDVKLNFYLTNIEINALAKIIHNVLYDTFPKLKIFVNYLKDMNRLLKKLNLNTIWLSPGGLIIEQRYVDKKKIELISTMLGKKKTITFNKLIKEKINLRKQNEAIVPNIVHSFDASNVSLLIKELIKHKRDMNVFTVHDCFASNANNVEIMILQVKLAFLFLYSNVQFVQFYHQFILDYIKNSGYTITLNGGEMYILTTTRKKHLIPTLPDFKCDKDFESNILGSHYFLN